MVLGPFSRADRAGCADQDDCAAGQPAAVDRFARLAPIARIEVGVAIGQIGAMNPRLPLVAIVRIQRRRFITGFAARRSGKYSRWVRLARAMESPLRSHASRNN